MSELDKRSKEYRDSRVANTSAGLMSADVAAHQNEARPERVSRMNQLKLSFPKYKRNEKEFFYKVATDDTGNLDAYESDYYEFCHMPDGSKVCIKDKGQTHYLMRLPMKYRLEDLRLADERISGTIKDVQAIGSKEGFYLPDGKKSAMTLDRSDPLDPDAFN